jgi:GNAT superfamily N-acetyltransferase
MNARRADADDADELIRLRAVMLRSMSPADWNDDWRPHARRALVERLPTESMAAFVVDRPDGAGLASCAIGVIEERLGGPANPFGRSGYVFSVATDPSLRRRGYSRLCMSALLDWFWSTGIRKVDLRASTEGEPLYRSLGFVRTDEPAMRLRL